MQRDNTKRTINMTYLVFYFSFVIETPAFYWPEWRSRILTLLPPALPLLSALILSSS